jgi:hypothetical protein
MTPMDQLNRVSARNGWIAERMTVMPIDVQLESEEPKTPTLDGATTAAVTIYICSKAYVGLTKQMRAQLNDAGSPEYRTASKGEVFGVDYRIIHKGRLNMFATRNGMDILDRLESLHRHGMDAGRECVMLYAVLMKLLVNAGVEAVKLGAAYGTQSTED